MLAATNASAQSTPSPAPVPAASGNSTPAATSALPGWINPGSAPTSGWTNAIPPNTALGSWLLKPAGDPLDQGRIIFNSRLSNEYASQMGLKQSDALTLRTRVGYQTPSYAGFYGLGAFENTWSLDPRNYGNFPAPFNNGHAVIPDARNNQLNQLLLGFNGFNSNVTAGRQEINLDNQRFVGVSDWRQNETTYDAIRVQTTMLENFWLSYTYNWNVNRIYGEYAPTSILNHFPSSNQFINIHYTGLPELGTFGGYLYHLNLGPGATAARTTAAGTQTLSSDTVGVFLDGRYKFNQDWSAVYRLEYASQANNGASGPGVAFSENYWRATAGAAYQKYEAGFTFENLGGNGKQGFQTPLATLHPYDGWANDFLTTPAAGLRDYYGYFKASLPGAIDLEAQLHYFTAEHTDTTYGREADIMLSHKINENWTILGEAAFYDGNGHFPGTAATNPFSANITKYWIRVTFSL